MIVISYGQSAARSKGDTLAKVKKPELFTTGFIDVLNNGQVNASARVIRVFIGEPGKIGIPLSLYSGVSANNFQQNAQPGKRSNDHLLNNFINPLSGLVNVSMDGLVFFKKGNHITNSGFTYHVGEKVLTGFKVGAPNAPQTGNPVNFLNSYGAAGFYFQTGAWEKTNSRNVGVFWLSYRFIGCYSNPNQIRQFLPEITTNGIYYGTCIGGGIDINDVIDLKVLYYKYIKRPEIDYSAPICQFTFNYSMKQ
jgi:hypothetical protein